MALDQMSGYETPQNPTNSDPSENDDQQPTAFRGMDTGSITSHGDSMHDEGKTTSRVNRAAEGEPEIEDSSDAGKGAGTDMGRPPRENGDTGYSG